MGIISKDIAIDLGTSNIRMYVEGRGQVLDEPCVVAINKITGEVLEVGKSAKEMLGRTPDNIIAISPMKNGVIADFDATAILLNSLLSKITSKSIFSKPRLIISIPYEITDVEERAVEGVAYKASAKEVYLIEEIMASSIGVKLPLEEPKGSMIVNIGGGTTEVAVMSLGGIVSASSLKFGGDEFDRNIKEYAESKYNVLISIGDAEDIKKNIGSAYLTMSEEKYKVKGRNLSTGLPEEIEFTSKDVIAAIEKTLEVILKGVKKVLEKTPPEMSADILENGITITGGCANIKNIDRYFNNKLDINIHIADTPELSVINGMSKALKNINMLKKAKKVRKS